MEPFVLADVNERFAVMSSGGAKLGSQFRVKKNYLRKVRPFETAERARSGVLDFVKSGYLKIPQSG